MRNPRFNHKVGSQPHEATDACKASFLLKPKVIASKKRVFRDTISAS